MDESTLAAPTTDEELPAGAVGQHKRPRPVEQEEEEEPPQEVLHSTAEPPQWSRKKVDPGQNAGRFAARVAADKAKGKEQQQEDEGSEAAAAHPAAAAAATAAAVAPGMAAAAAAPAAAAAAEPKAKRPCSEEGEAAEMMHAELPFSGQELVGRRVEIYWDGDAVWYPGTVVSHLDSGRNSGHHRVFYDDGATETAALSGADRVACRMLQLPPASASAARAAAPPRAAAKTKKPQEKRPRESLKKQSTGRRARENNSRVKVPGGVSVDGAHLLWTEKETAALERMVDEEGYPNDDETAEDMARRLGTDRNAGSINAKVHTIKAANKEKLISDLFVEMSLAAAAQAAAVASEAAGGADAPPPDQLDEDHYNAYHVVEAVIDRRNQKTRGNKKAKPGQLQYRVRWKVRPAGSCTF